MNIAEQIKRLQLVIPPAPGLGGVYKPVVIIDNMLYVSGQGPLQNDGTLIIGKLGQDLDVDQGYQAARQVGLTMLSTLQDQIEDLGKIKRLVKTLGMVNSVLDFYQQPQVINGFSDLMVEVLGEDLGKGARSAVGMILPGNIAVEIEAIFQLH